MNIFYQQLINALTYGSLIGFIALGYSLVYGILKLINFAHGHIVTFAIFITMSMLTEFSAMHTFGFILALSSALIITIIVTIILELVAYRPLRKANRLSLIVSALGAGMVIENAIMLIWGPNPKVFPDINFFQGSINLNGVIISELNLFILVLNIVVMTILYLFINKSRTGIAIKALSQDYQTAQLMGVNINKIIVLVFILGAIIGSVGGVLIGLTYKTVSFNMGVEYGLKAFIAAIIGGIGSIPGAMLGGLIIGILQTLSTGYISSIWANVITYSLLILLLIIRPRGILGQKDIEKV
jgi:branched-chain amino acid transport system permease protein